MGSQYLLVAMVRIGISSRLKSSNGKVGTASQDEIRASSPMRTPAEVKGLVLKTKVLRVSRLGPCFFRGFLSLTLFIYRHGTLRQRIRVAQVIQ